MLVEVCCNSLESALNAQKAGADRIELCSELGVGGLTPSYGLLKLVKEALEIPIHVLIRPRGGHFSYSDSELKVMKTNIAFCREIGVNGIVTGVLTKDFYVHRDQTAELIEAAKSMKFTFHRAFDWVVNPHDAITELDELGVDTVLTSGQQPNADVALKLLLELQEKTSKVQVMAGGGINLSNALLFKEAGLSAIHLSGSKFGQVVNVSHKIPMSSAKHLQEHQVAVTDSEVVRQVINAVK
ncbi:copper homeostasis protein CutC [Croceivirga thetidis]|uniref:PF03932 family protein CutC n=1 Tax=Croceivirga thetidis TaxID=2721623 RepID=A0ABX1GL75_9FLAO|nr:copper homeostasis protein CutC [Croceivirga thetidis]NKI30652.1 copper homeostasis protein CutC [Croceivirga thetidis]